MLQTPRGAVYCLSQRAEHIWEGVSSATTRSRPIINTRDEPHADAERYRRLHVIVGDSNMNEVTTLLKVGSADIVLRMIEAGVAMRDLTLENPIRAIREVSHDITGRRKVRLVNGKECSALEIQQEYFAKASEFVERRGADATAKRVLDLWGRVLAGVESGDLSGVEREIDWVTKLRLVERYQARHDLPLSHPRIAQMDLAYHDLRRNRGLYALLETQAARSTGSPPTWRSSRRRRRRRRPPGPGCAASSSATPRRSGATSPSTGCTSSSTTRPSAPYCARTRSGPTTSGSTG